MNGLELHKLAARLYPICRSITGPGVRETLAILQETIPLTVESVPSGTPVFDWVVPNEWTVREAWLADRKGNRLVDFKNHNLHLLNYSEPFCGIVSRADLDAHLFSLPDQPDAIPYRTSYYRKEWGFCLTENQRASLTESEYEVSIDTELTAGVFNYGELLIPGRVQDEILISTHICHPSLANDNLSGIVVALETARRLLATPPNYSVRFVFVPGTIGAITWLARNQTKLSSIHHALVLTGLGVGNTFHYKQSRSGNAAIDRVTAHVLQTSGSRYQIEPFVPYGYDERQYNSPGILLDAGCLTRAPYGTYPEYHTSLDNLHFLQAEALEESTELVGSVITALGARQTFRNRFPFGEPQLGKRGLYAANPAENLTFLWILNLSDGTNSLDDIAARSGISLADLEVAARRLLDAGLIETAADFPCESAVNK